MNDSTVQPLSRDALKELYRSYGLLLPQCMTGGAAPDSSTTQPQAAAAQSVAQQPPPPPAPAQSEQPQQKQAGVEARAEAFYEGSAPLPPPQPRTLSRDEIIHRLREFVVTGRPKGTGRTYDTYQRQFTEYCERNGWDPYAPNQADTYIASFLVDCTTRSKPLAASTILGPVTGALADMYNLDDTESQDKPPTQSVLVRALKRTIKRTAPHPKKAKAALTPELVRSVVLAARKDKDSTVGWRDVCVILTMYTALTRSSETMSLKPSNLQWSKSDEGKKTERSGVVVVVERAKNDQEGKGQRRFVPQSNGEPDLCLYRALRSYKPLIDGRASTAFYNARTFKPLSPATATHILRQRLSQAGVSGPELSTYASNSLRKGGVTRALAAGVDVRAVMSFGWWKSSAVFAYQQISDGQRTEVADAILKEIDGDEEEDEEAGLERASLRDAGGGSGAGGAGAGAHAPAASTHAVSTQPPVRTYTQGRSYAKRKSED